LKTLVLMRHGKSSWKDIQLSDFDRPLKKRGKRDTPIMGQLLCNEGIIPDYVLSSPALRCRETVELLYDPLELSDDMVDYVEDFYQADTMNYLEVIADLSDGFSRILIVGHNPSLEGLLQYLTGDSEVLPTAAAAWIKLPIHDWEEIIDDDIQGTLVKLWRPKEL